MSQSHVRCRLYGIVALSLLLRVASVGGQMTLPTSGVLPSGTINRSLILGDDLSSLQASWLAPVNPVQAEWRNQINGVANGSLVGSPPTTFASAASASSVAEAAGLRFAMTGNVADLNKAVTGLLHADVPGGTFITRPEVLTTYLSAYDFIRGASSADLSAAMRTQIETRLTSLALSLDNGNQTLSNARGKIGGTRALAGVLLQNQGLLDTGLSDLNSHFSYSTTDDGWFTDSQSHYLNYTLRHETLFVRAYQQGSGVDLYANFAPYLSMTVGVRLPDGTIPSVSNGLAIRSGVSLFASSTNPTDASLALWSLQSGTPTNYNGYAGTNLLNNVNEPATFYALIDWANVSPQAPTTSPTFISTDQSHVSVFRTDWSTSSDYLMLSPGVDSPGLRIENLVALPAFHSHNDTGEILLAAKGQYILVSPGYNRTDLPTSPAGMNLQLADQHNVILVDGSVGNVTATLGGGPFLGQFQRPENFVHANRLDSAEFGNFKGVSDFASLQMNYNDTDVRRNTAFANEDYFVVADRMQSASSHTYGFNLIGRGSQTVIQNSADRIEVVWDYNGARVREHLFSSAAMTLLTDTKWMHATFGNFETTYRMLANVTGDHELYLSLLETSSTGAASSLDITKLASAAGSLALLVDHQTLPWTDTIMTQLGHSLLSAGGVTSDANYAYVRQVGSMLQSLMMSEGTELTFGGQNIIELSQTATLSLVFSPNEARGTISADQLLPGTQLRFFGRGFITGAWINGQSVTFGNQSGINTVLLSQPGDLRVQFSAIPEAGSLLLVGIGIVGGLLVAFGRPNRQG
ncbi:heparinase II/III family protein [bacterium]|nr:heparinase II/III family protein [bacterium]